MNALEKITGLVKGYPRADILRDFHIDYLHWWTFLAAYYEIGECTFAQIVHIRDKLSRGQRLDKTDQEWYRRNRELVDFKRKYTDAEDELMKQWGGG